MALEDPTATAPQDQTAASGATPVLTAHFMPTLRERVLLMDFLELSYDGGLGYKVGRDPTGFEILAKHESEFYAPQAVAMSSTSGQPTPETIQLDRYGRRQRLASYENHYGPIVDKYSSFLTQSLPKRSQKAAPEATRLKLDANIRETINVGLKLTEAWIGWDQAALTGASTVAEAKSLDPENAGKVYLCRRDPRRVVDYTLAPDGRVSRVVFEETVEVKPSLTSPVTRTTQYREWTDTEWRLYKAVSEDKAPDGVMNWKPSSVNSLVAAVHVQLDDSGTHGFGRCPWERFRPKFPSEDLAEQCRLLFNILSWLDEELYKNTFTQKVAIGVTPQQLASATSGPGNWLAIANVDAKIDVIGAIDGQAKSLLERAADIREAIFAIASMEHSKNVIRGAESAEKRRLDMQQLYSALVKITEEVERVENSLLAGMGVIDAADASQLTRYDREFDITSLEDLLADMKALALLPFAPAKLKRSMMKLAVGKIDPFSDPVEYEEEIADSIDATLPTAQAIDALKAAGALTPDLAVTVIGVPEDEEADFKARFDGHVDPTLEPAPEPDEIGGEDVQPVPPEDGGDVQSSAGDLLPAGSPAADGAA
jgi:hypothetical protein